MKYYYQEHGYHMVGDLVNHHRYSDLKAAYEYHDLAGFFNETGCAWMITDTTAFKKLTGIYWKDFSDEMQRAPRLDVVFQKDRHAIIHLPRTE